MLFNFVAALSVLVAASGVFAQDNVCLLCFLGDWCFQPITAPTAGQVIAAGIFLDDWGMGLMV
jgi:hypothetical protein